MIKTGVLFIISAAVLWGLAFLTVLSKAFFIVIPAALIFGVIGSVLVLIGVIRDRKKEKEEEEGNDYSKY